MFFRIFGNRAYIQSLDIGISYQCCKLIRRNGFEILSFLLTGNESGKEQANTCKNAFISLLILVGIENVIKVITFSFMMPDIAENICIVFTIQQKEDARSTGILFPFVTSTTEAH